MQVMAVSTGVDIRAMQQQPLPCCVHCVQAEHALAYLTVVILNISKVRQLQVI